LQLIALSGGVPHCCTLGTTTETSRIMALKVTFTGAEAPLI
jgi:hypothetical protein